MRTKVALVICIALTASSRATTAAFPSKITKVTVSEQSTITLALPSYSLDDICRIFESRSGVVHKTRSTAVGDLMVSMVGTSNVAAFRTALEDVLPIRWRSEVKNGQTEYVAEFLPDAVRKENELLADYDGRRSRQFENMIRAASASDDEFSQLPALVKARLRDPVNRRGWASLGGFSEDERRRLGVGQFVSRPGRTLSDDQKGVFASIYEAAVQGSAQAGLANRGAPPGDVTDGGVRVSSLPLGYELILQGSDRPRLIVMLQCGVPFTESTDPSTFRSQQTDGAEEVIQPGPPEGAGDAAGRKTWWEILVRLSRTLGHPVVSDATHELDEYKDLLPVPPRMSLGGYLTMCSKAWMRRWGKVGDVITLTACDAPVRRRGDIPDSAFHRWRDRITKAGGCELEVLAEMATLSDYQVQNLYLVTAQQRGAPDSLSVRVVDARPVLQVWSLLPSQSRRQAAGTGLPLRALPQNLQRITSGLLGVNSILRVQQAKGTVTYQIASPDQPLVSGEVLTAIKPGLVEQLVKQEKEHRETLQLHLHMPEGPAN